MIEAGPVPLLGGRVTTFQPAKGYRSAIDAILLPAAVPAQTGDRVLELGAGVGSASLCLAARVEGVTVAGLEQIEELVALAEKGAEASDLAGRVTFHAGDLLAPPPDLGAGFDHVMANPPFQKAGASRPSPDPIKRAATVEGDATLADWVRFAFERARPGGTVSVIHHGDRGAELLALMAAGGRGTRIWDIHADPAAERPLRILAQAVAGEEGSSAGTSQRTRLDLHGRHPGGGSPYLPDIEAVLRNAQPLPI